MSEKPLHVQVAEALGYPEPQLCEGETWHFDVAAGSGSAYRAEFSPVWRDRYDYGDRHRCDHELNVIPRYDIDWSATGPLIEHFSLDLYRKTGDGNWSAAAWLPNDNPTENKRVDGSTPLIAVCNLILALKAAGKLNA